MDEGKVEEQAVEQFPLCVDCSAADTCSDERKQHHADILTSGSIHKEETPLLTAMSKLRNVDKWAHATLHSIRIRPVHNGWLVTYKYIDRTETRVYEVCTPESSISVPDTLRRVRLELADALQASRKAEDALRFQQEDDQSLADDLSSDAL